MSQQDAHVELPEEQLLNEFKQIIHDLRSRGATEKEIKESLQAMYQKFIASVDPSLVTSLDKIQSRIDDIVKLAESIGKKEWIAISKELLEQGVIDDSITTGGDDDDAESEFNCQSDNDSRLQSNDGKQPLSKAHLPIFASFLFGMTAATFLLENSRLSRRTRVICFATVLNAVVQKAMTADLSALCRPHVDSNEKK